MKRLLSSFILIILIYCNPTPTLYFNPDFKPKTDNNIFAILNFDYNGSLLSSAIANNATDQFTSEFYIKTGLPVVERNIVRNTERELELTSLNRLSAEQISILSDKLSADYLIVGSLVSLRSIDDYYSDEGIELKLTVRILNAASKDLVAMVQHQISGKGNVNILVQELVNQAVFTMNREL